MKTEKGRGRENNGAETEQDAPLRLHFNSIAIGGSNPLLGLAESWR
ncbi:MAG: hypothetical protein IPM61_07395 [Chlorobi bacterium]|nr:hypothetical protein [Chlorobiota bacterium]